MDTRNTIAVLALFGVLLAGGVFALADSANDKDQARLEQLIKERWDIADKYRQAAEAAYQADTIVLDQFLEALNRFRDADLSLRPNEELEVLESHLDRVKKVEHHIGLLFERGSKGGAANEYYLAVLEMQNAEIALIRARQKPKR